MTDNCPECLARDVRPDRTREAFGVVVALYTCPACGEQWSCSWDAASLDPTTLHDLRTAVYAGAPGKHTRTRTT